MNAARLLSGVGLLLSLTKCGNKETYPVIVPIGFLPAVTIRPASRTMHVGDTLWLEANFSDSLPDKNSGRRFRVQPQDMALNSALVYKELLGIGQQPKGIASTFRLVEKVGKASIDGTLTGSFEPAYDGHYYRAKIGLIPSRACITSISMLVSPAGGARAIGTFIPFIQLPVDAQGKEQKALYDDSFYVINDGKANNFDLFRQYYNARSLDPGVSAETILYEQKSTFTVEVK